MKNIERKIHTIDATGKAPGRIATQVAVFLQGKHKPEYETHIDIGDFVKVTNAKDMVFSGKKFEQKVYIKHRMRTGLKLTPVKSQMSADPTKVLEMAVIKMLPKNKLRSNRMKRLSIK